MLKTLISVAFGAIMLGQAALANYHGFSADDVADFEILPGWRTQSGTHMTALRIVLKPGWKTYWRAPGDAGIPARFDWGRSKNVSSVRFYWPTPDVFTQNGLRTVGYKKELVLPIELTPKKPGTPIKMRADVELGVCQDICIPVSVRVSADIEGAGASDIRISAAMSARPDTSREAGMRSISCKVDPISDGLRLTASIDLPRVGPQEVAIFELSNQSIWVSEANVQRNGRALTATVEMVPPNSKPFSLDRSDVRITVIGTGRAVDIRGCKM